ncbi:MAG: hypothetical protein JRJ45_03660 [Deltaproteobacteria bacterium]|nr:hypothetical protein [Deltaproteobacteria bacterium]
MSTDPGTDRITKTITSGTTGTPFTTGISKSALTVSDAFSWRRTRWAGYRDGQWIARLVGDPVIPLRLSNPEKPWRISWTDKRIYLSTFHLNIDMASCYLDVLERMQPDYLMGYPSSLEILAAFLMELGREITWSPKEIFFSSETLYSHQEELIKKAFGAPLRGFYGSAERIISASQCDKRNYHLGLLDGYAEGQFGIITAHNPALSTTLVNKVMPLIRFPIGDWIKFRPDIECPCGRTLPLIDPVVTKHEDWVVTPSGRRISSSIITFAFKDLAGVRRSQVVQVSKYCVVVFLDATELHYDKAAKIVSRRLYDMFFGELSIRCVRNNNIKISMAGKTQFVVRQV